MYADRYAPAPRLKPGSLAVAIAINGAVLAALIYSAPEEFRTIIDKGLVTRNIPVPKDPPPEEQPRPKRAAQPSPKPQIDQPETIVEHTATDPGPILFTGPVVEVGPVEGTGTGNGNGVAIEAPPPPPVFVDPVLDQRYAGSFQPTYPTDERRADREGSVVVRVLIGIDGRVKQVEQVRATSDSFFKATMRRALEAWRFKPGTRNGVPVERWRQITVSFHLEDE